MIHKIMLVPQSIADGWQAKCTCGWQTFASFYDYAEKDALLAELNRRFSEHIKILSENPT